MKTPTPNILFFFTDDQRFDTIHALGNEQVHTPNLDYLARNGTAFTNAYIMGGSCPAVCMPSRAMLMTGRSLFHIQGEGQTIPESHVMLPEHLRRAGYRTFGAGKWHNGTESYVRSFSAGGAIFFGGMADHWNLPACGFRPDGRYPEPAECRQKMTLGQPVEVREFRHDRIQRGRHSTELVARAGREFLETTDDETPFFMFLSFLAPHDPRTMPQRFLTQYVQEEIRLPESYLPEHPFDNGELRIRDELLEAFPRTPEAVRRHTAEYYAMISHVDAEIGGVLDMLKATGQYENTIIILAGDNGLAVGRHGLLGKQSNYDHSVHVPLIMAGPGIPRGERRDAYCYLLDIFPTLCEAADLPIPESVEGRSLSPILGDPAAAGRDELLFAYRDLHRSLLRNGKKLITYNVAGATRRQLFDLRRDPWETNDLAGDERHAATMADLQRRLLAQMRGADDPVAATWRTESG
jgi:arylsulfatase A-like enzyme